jgi:hypothetical protein
MLVSFIVYKLAMTETRSRRHSDDTLTVRLIVNPSVAGRLKTIRIAGGLSRAA